MCAQFRLKFMCSHVYVVAQHEMHSFFLLMKDTKKNDTCGNIRWFYEDHNTGNEIALILITNSLSDGSSG